MQINRLFEIVYILLDKKIVSAKELANRFKVSTRTIYRDIEVLSYSGIPVFANKGKGGGIALLPNFVLNKTLLTQSEKTNILTALQSMNTINADLVQSTLLKLGALFGEHNANWIEVDFSGWYNSEEIGRLFTLFKQAILSKNRVQFDYFNANNKSGGRTAEPLKLLFKGGSWYLYAFCMVKNDYRLFKLSRIKNISVLDETFTRNLINTVFSENWGFQDEFIELKLKIDKKMAYRVYDEFELNCVNTDSNGDFNVTIKYPKGEWIFSFIMSFGTAIEVLEPAEIREEIKTKLKEIFKKYF